VDSEVDRARSDSVDDRSPGDRPPGGRPPGGRPPGDHSLDDRQPDDRQSGACSLDDRSLDGIFAARVMEHLTSSELIDLLALAADKMKRGARLIIESPNVDTFSALRRFYVDPTRRQPIGVTTLHFLLTMNGFLVEEVTYLGGALDQERLQKLPTPSNVRDGDPLSVLAHRYNHNVDTLNRVLFGHQDYAVIAQR